MRTPTFLSCVTTIRRRRNKMKNILRGVVCVLVLMVTMSGAALFAKGAGDFGETSD